MRPACQSCRGWRAMTRWRPGAINHALRFTAPETRRHISGRRATSVLHLTGAQYPPMGQRFRLKASFDISGFSPAAQVILQALKKYGMILADNGSSWYISGAPERALEQRRPARIVSG